MVNLQRKILFVLLISSLLAASAGIGVVNAQTLPGQDDENRGTTEVTLGSIVPQVSYTGKVSWSIDALGVYPGSTGTIQVDKPSGATVKAAFMAVATRGFSNYQLAAGDVKIDGSNFVWSIETPSSINSWNYWGAVTSLVKTKIDGAPAGIIDFTIAEDDTYDIEGEILVVIFDDPSQTAVNTIVLLFGAQAVDGDTFNIGLAEPLDLSVSTLLDLSLGISYGHQGTEQYSQVNVNSARLTTSAGGEDDGETYNGALITVGGIGDSNDNPADPYATPTNPRSDDELYSLISFVETGDTGITVNTNNPSDDDNILFAGLFLTGAVAVVNEGIVLTPVEAINYVASPHTVTALVQDGNGDPISGITVTFEIVSGPNFGTTETATTNEEGLASFSYTSTSLGTDTIVASFVNSEEETVESNQVTKTWIPTSNAIPEVPFGTLSASISIVAAFGFFVYYKKQSKSKKQNS